MRRIHPLLTTIALGLLLVGCVPSESTSEREEAGAVTEKTCSPITEPLTFDEVKLNGSLDGGEYLLFLLYGSEHQEGGRDEPVLISSQEVPVDGAGTYRPSDVDLPPWESCWTKYEMQVSLHGSDGIVIQQLDSQYVK